jgi:hypothetical protein
MNNIAVNCVANTTNTLIRLLYDDEDDDLLLSEPGLTHRVLPRPLPTGKVATTTTSTPVCNKRAAFTPSDERTAKKRKLVLQKSYAVISVFTTSGRDANEEACRNRWHRKELKTVGVYTSKQAAESAKRGMMELYKRGHDGEILEGGCLDDELDMFIREDTQYMIGPRST